MPLVRLDALGVRGRPRLAGIKLCRGLTNRRLLQVAEVIWRLKVVRVWAAALLQGGIHKIGGLAKLCADLTCPDPKKLAQQMGYLDWGLAPAGGPAPAGAAASPPLGLAKGGMPGTSAAALPAPVPAPALTPTPCATAGGPGATVATCGERPGSLAAPAPCRPEEGAGHQAAGPEAAGLKVARQPVPRGPPPKLEVDAKSVGLGCPAGLPTATLHSGGLHRDGLG